MASGAYLYVDMTDFSKKLGQMRSALSQEKAEKLLRRTLNEVGSRAIKPILRKELPKQYVVPLSFISNAVGGPKIQSAGSSVSCSIPLSGVRRIAASNKKKGRISVKILKGKTSTLPSAMTHQGGYPPFTKNGLVFTRKTDKSFPIARVATLSVPQMPLSRSRTGVENEIERRMIDRLEHNFQYMFR